MACTVGDSLVEPVLLPLGPERWRVLWGFVGRASVITTRLREMACTVGDSLVEPV